MVLFTKYQQDIRWYLPTKLRENPGESGGNAVIVYWEDYTSLTYHDRMAGKCPNFH